MSSTPFVSARRLSLALMGVLVTLWVAVFAIYLYGAHHIFSVGWPFNLLTSAVRCVAVVAAIGFGVHALWTRAWRRAISIVVIGVIGVVFMGQLEPQRSEYWHAYNRELSARHANLVALAAAYDRGAVHDGSPLPASLRTLSRDGLAHVWALTGAPDVLFIQRWQDWRGESGDGIAYFPSSPAPGTEVVTPAGDLGEPTRNLGDGWWLVPS